MKVHWPNPWKVIYVPIDELADCYVNLGKTCGRSDGSSFVWTKEEVLKHWRHAGEKLDAYILPASSGEHCIGIRYGAEGSQYLSPGGDKTKVSALLRKHS